MNTLQKGRLLEFARALESGFYRQGNHVLKDSRTDTYCFWGVGCEVSGLGKFRTYQDEEHFYLNEVIDADGPADVCATPPSVRLYYGVDEQTYGQLMTWNDCGTNFVNQVRFPELARALRHLVEHECLPDFESESQDWDHYRVQEEPNN